MSSPPPHFLQGTDCILVACLRLLTPGCDTAILVTCKALPEGEGSSVSLLLLRRVLCECGVRIGDCYREVGRRSWTEY